MLNKMSNVCTSTFNTVLWLSFATLDLHFLNEISQLTMRFGSLLLVVQLPIKQYETNVHKTATLVVKILYIQDNITAS